MLAAFGVEQRNEYECYIDRVADPARLFSTLKIGEPTSKMEPE
jgi:hypothetical protein